MAGELMDFDITCIEFSEEIKGRCFNIMYGKPIAPLMSDEIKQIVDAVLRSGAFLAMAKGQQQITDESLKEQSEAIMAEALQTERESQHTLKSAGITDDTTADRWLIPIEEKLKIARSEYQKLSDRQAAERETFCKQWMVE